MVIFVPGYITLNSRNPKKSINGDSKEKELCKVKPDFFFEKPYLDRIAELEVGKECVEIRYEINGKPKWFTLPVSIRISLLDIGEEKLTPNYIPMAVSIHVENAPTNFDDLIAVPFFLAWRNGCGSESSPNPFLDELRGKIKESLEKRLEEPISEIILSEKGRFFIASIEVPWEKVRENFGDDASIQKVVTNCPREFYGLAVTDEGYRAVKNEHAIEKIKDWIHGNRVYFEEIVSPTSLILVKADKKRTDFEKMTLPECNIWKEYVLAHEKERKMVCHHGIFYQGQYIALTFSTLEMLNFLVKRTIKDVKTKNALQEEDIGKILQDLKNLKISLESYLKFLSPKRVSKLGGITLIMEKMYEARGLSTFSVELEEAIETLTKVMKEGEELIEKRLEREKFQHLEIGITLLEALPIGYVGQWVLQAFNLNFPTPVVVGATAPLLLGAWWLYKLKKVKKWEKEQARAFVTMAEKILDSLV